MSKLTLLVAATAFAACANTGERLAASPETAKLVTACNGAADTGAGRRPMRACEALEKQDRLSLVEPATVVAYRQYQEDVKRRQASIESSPRGMSRGR